MINNKDNTKIAMNISKFKKNLLAIAKAIHTPKKFFFNYMHIYKYFLMVQNGQMEIQIFCVTRFSFSLSYKTCKYFENRK